MNFYLMGTAPGFVPETLDHEFIDKIYLASEREAFDRCREIARVQGLLESSKVNY